MRDPLVEESIACGVPADLHSWSTVPPPANVLAETQGVLCSRMGEYERALGHLQLLLGFFEEQRAASRLVGQPIARKSESVSRNENAPGDAASFSTSCVRVSQETPRACRHRHPTIGATARFSRTLCTTESMPPPQPCFFVNTHLRRRPLFRGYRFQHTS